MAPKSKSVAAWLALLLGSLGVHRLYLYGKSDWLAWLHPLPTAIGLLGLQRLLQLGQDDRMAWLLIPLLGLMLSQGMFCAIVYGLTADATWDARHNPGRSGTPASWLSVFAAATALLIGGGVLVGTIAYSGQKFFEWQLDGERADRGRERRSPSPPSEPAVQFSRDGLSSQLFPHRDWRAT